MSAAEKVLAQISREEEKLLEMKTSYTTLFYQTLKMRDDYDHQKFLLIKGINTLRIAFPENIDRAYLSKFMQIRESANRIPSLPEWSTDTFTPAYVFRMLNTIQRVKAEAEELFRSTQEAAESFKNLKSPDELVQKIEAAADKANRALIDAQDLPRQATECLEKLAGVASSQWEGTIQQTSPERREASYIEFLVTKTGDKEIKITFPSSPRDRDPERFVKIDYQIKTVEQNKIHASQGYPLYFDLVGNVYRHTYSETKTKPVRNLGNVNYKYERFIELVFQGDSMTGDIRESLKATAGTSGGRRIQISDQTEVRQVKAKRKK
jgi:hypothetical protein